MNNPLRIELQQNSCTPNISYHRTSNYQVKRHPIRFEIHLLICIINLDSIYITIHIHSIRYILIYLWLIIKPWCYPIGFPTWNRGSRRPQIMLHCRRQSTLCCVVNGNPSRRFRFNDPSIGLVSTWLVLLLRCLEMCFDELVDFGTVAE